MDFDDDDDGRSSAISRTRSHQMSRGAAYSSPYSHTGQKGGGPGGGPGGGNDNFLDIQTEPHIVDPDEEFEGECCFWLMKLLRGHNVGRRLKRKIFKYSLLNLIVGFSMLVITVYEGEYE